MLIFSFTDGKPCMHRTGSSYNELVRQTSWSPRRIFEQFQRTWWRNYPGEALISTPCISLLVNERIGVQKCLIDTLLHSHTRVLMDGKPLVGHKWFAVSNLYFEVSKGGCRHFLSSNPRLLLTTLYRFLYFSMWYCPKQNRTEILVL